MKATDGFQATMTARPGTGDELIELLLSVVKGGTDPNCVLFLVGHAAGNRDVVNVWEGWTTKEAHAENFASDKAKAFVAKLAPLLDGEAQYQEAVPVGGRLEVD
jgi:quinol monooxygenase YgiN